MQSILGILYSVSQIQNFCILHDAVDFMYFVFSFPDAEFLHLSLMQSILGILYPVIFTYFVFILSNA